MSDTCDISFSRFGVEDYRLFLKAKSIPEFTVLTGEDGLSSGLRFPSRFAHLVGMEVKQVEREWLPMPDFLFDDQRAIVAMALEAKRFADWKDCGLGKTLEQAEWARQVAHITGKRVLVVTFSEIIPQWVEEANNFYGSPDKQHRDATRMAGQAYPVTVLTSREAMRKWCGETIGYTAPDAASDEDRVIDAALHHVAEQDVLRKLLAGRSWPEAFGGPGGMGFKGFMWHGDAKGIRIQCGEEESYQIKPARILERARQYRPSAPVIGITNYEKFNPTDGVERIPEIGMLGGIALDESSRLKTGGGKQKWSIIKSSRGVPYKLSATGTPAPNEVMEFASQASFLERIRDENDVIWTYFTRGKDNEWTVKRHARPHFFRWMASWSIYVADPRRYGWRKDAPDVPQPEFQYDEIAPTLEQTRLQQTACAGAAGGTGELFGDRRFGMVTQLQLLEAAKGFLYGSAECGVRSAELGTGNGELKTTANGKQYRLIASEKPMWVATLAKAQFCAGRQTLVWCEYDAEVDILAELLKGLGLANYFRVLGGGTKAAERLKALEMFRHGDLPILLGKARMLGYGQNFQRCSSMIFSGFSDSFEAFYQAVRRSYRYGQRERLKVFIPFVPLLEGPVLRNLLNKVTRFGELIREQEEAYLEARRELQPQMNADKR